MKQVAQILKYPGWNVKPSRFKDQLLGLIMMIMAIVPLYVHATSDKPQTSHSWAQTLADKKGAISIYYFQVDPFVMENEQGDLEGIEYELMAQFIKFIEEKHGLSIDARFQHIDRFSVLYETVKNGTGGIFGMASFSITPTRKKEVLFSPPYMPDIEVLICSRDVPIVTSLEKFRSTFSSLKALNVANTTFDQNLQALKKDQLPGMEIENVANSNEIRRRIATEEGLFSYCELPTYLMVLKNGLKLKRQHLFKVQREGYGIILPMTSDWQEPLHEFFNDPSFRPFMNRIIRKYLGSDVKDLLWDISQQETLEGNKEVMLLTKEKEIQNLELAKNALELNRQRIIIYFIAITLFFVVLLVIFVYRGYKQKKESTEQLAIKNDKIEKAYQLIEQKNRDITDSINYAKRIQHAILNSNDYLSQSKLEHFVFLRPKDIVSGDFYWAIEKEGKLTIAVADCTGHGVPGAFMSMLGIAFLNEIQKTNLSPDETLNQLREKVITHLGQDKNDRDNKDGMDVSLCQIDLKTLEVHYAGAYNSMFVIRNSAVSIPQNDQEEEPGMLIHHMEGNEEKVMVEIKGDKQPIGIFLKPKPFTKRIFQLEPDDVIYLSTDGFPDQFGGENNRKYTFKRFRQLLFHLHQLPISEQEGKIEETLTQWKGQRDQIDDICVMGLRV